MPIGALAALVAVAASLAAASMLVLTTHLGPAAGMVHAVFVVAALLALERRRWWPETASPPAARRLALAALVAVALGTVLVYAVATSGRLGGGADSDDALVVAVSEIAAGRYPYTATTYLGNPISPLPGALVIAAPFVALGHVELLNVAVLAGLLFTASWHLGRIGSALLLGGALLALSPSLLHQLATGGDYFANAASVLLALWWLWRFQAPPERAAGAAPWLAAAALGVAIAWRANFALLLPLVVAHQASRAGWRRAVAAGSLAGFVAAGLTLPFYLYDPAGFSPLHTANKLARFDSLLPHAGVLLPAGALVTALALAVRPGQGLAALLWRCAAVQAAPVLPGLVLAALDGGLPIVASVATFANFPLPFAVVAWWLGRDARLAAASSP